MTVIKTYDVGDLARLQAQFADENNAATDPTTVTLKVRAPGGTVTTYVYETDEEVVKVSTGRFRAEIPVTAEGTWHYRWEGTGDVTAAGEKQFNVRETVFY